MTVTIRIIEKEKKTGVFTSTILTSYQSFLILINKNSRGVGNASSRLRAPWLPSITCCKTLLTQSRDFFPIKRFNYRRLQQYGETIFFQPSSLFLSLEISSRKINESKSTMYNELSQESYKGREMGRYNRTFVIISLFFLTYSFLRRLRDSREKERERDTLQVIFPKIVLKVSPALVIFNNPP